jgi:bacillithiol system protein YtxJ
MKWNNLTNTEQLEQIDRESEARAVLIYKHSTRCGISSTALGRIERRFREEDAEKLKPYFLDLLQYRELSQEVARRYNVGHESPQVLVIRNGKCIFTESHMGISYEALMSAA